MQNVVIDVLPADRAKDGGSYAGLVAAQCGVPLQQCGQVYAHEPELMIEGPMGNVYFRPMVFPKKGDQVAGHAHNFDHVTFLWRGSVRLRAWHTDTMTRDEKGDLHPPTEDKMIIRQYAAPARILIKKDWAHEFTALANQTMADCIYALRDFDGQPTDNWNGDETPYV